MPWESVGGAITLTRVGAAEVKRADRQAADVGWGRKQSGGGEDMRGHGSPEELREAALGGGGTLQFQVRKGSGGCAR